MNIIIGLILWPIAYSISEKDNLGAFLLTIVGIWFVRKVASFISDLWDRFKPVGSKERLEHLKTMLALQNLRIEHNKLLDEWNGLIRLINNRGGSSFLNSGRSTFTTVVEKSPFTPEEMKQLIILCHPDKHGGSELATEVTKKLLSLRDKQRG